MLFPTSLLVGWHVILPWRVNFHSHAGRSSILMLFTRKTWWFSMAICQSTCWTVELSTFFGGGWEILSKYEQVKKNINSAGKDGKSYTNPSPKGWEDASFRSVPWGPVPTIPSIFFVHSLVFFSEGELFTLTVVGFCLRSFESFARMYSLWLAFY